MKKVLDFIKSNIRQILEIFFLLVITFLPLLFDVKELFKDYLSNNSLTPDNFFPYYAITHGKYFVSILLFFSFLFWIRKFNDSFVMNRRNLYHDYSYFWYWVCAKILGIKKCNLVLVPIYMQYKLVIRSTFEEYPLNDEEYPSIENEPECIVTTNNSNTHMDKVNLIIEDTYKITDNQIPKSVKGIPTIRICRNDGTSKSRHFSQKLIESTIDTLRGFKRIESVNIFSTTNPKNTMHIAKRAFALDDRGGIRHLYVFQQKSNGRRVFEDKGHKVY